MTRKLSTRTTLPNATATGVIYSPQEILNRLKGNTSIDGGPTGLNGSSANNSAHHMMYHITTNYKSFNPHVSGYYYLQMIPGPWVAKMKDIAKQPASGGTPAAVGTTGYHEFSSYSTGTMDSTMYANYGTVALNIDLPNIDVEYEHISGRIKNISFADKVATGTDFTVNYIENSFIDVFRYHEAWLKYIDAYRRGFIVPGSNETPNSTEQFIDVTYYNAVWVVIFDPFTINVRGVVKLLGVSPTSLPMKQIIGERGKNELTMMSISYKCNDMVFKFFEDDSDCNSSPLYNECMKDLSGVMTSGNVTQQTTDNTKQGTLSNPSDNVNSTSTSSSTNSSTTTTTASNSSNGPGTVNGNLIF